MSPGLNSQGTEAVLEPAQARETIWQIGSLKYTKRSLVVLFFWLLWGDLCFMLMEQIATGTGGTGIVPLKLKSLEAPNWVIGLVMGTIPSTINMVCNPIISFKSDRFRSRWGRRIPFIMATLPLVVACLVAVAYGDQMGYALHGWLQGHRITFLGERVAGWIAGLSPNAVALITLSTALTLFAFFNVFVNSVFWYLFNDVVPEQMMGKFISGFRVVLLIKGFIYSLWIFPHAETHFTTIFVGAALLYLFGFGIMCLFVREGEYPAPPPYDHGRKGPIGAGVTYIKESGGLAHYWYLFIAGACLAATWAFSIFGVFYNQAIRLDNQAIGELGAIASATGLVAIVVSGWLADRYHPIRVVLWGLVLQILVLTPIGCIWLFWLPSPRMVFWITAIQSLVIATPVGALMQMYDPPLLMRIFPRDRYGQFCSANAMVRSLSVIIFGTLGGLIIDVIKYFSSESIAYRSLPILNVVAYIAMLYFLLKLYRSWKDHGGDESYVPPLPQDDRRGFEVVPDAKSTKMA